MGGRIKPITAVAVVFFIAAAIAPLFVSSWATLFALLLAKGIVVLGIASVLVVSVVQKRREIGILRAMGAPRAKVQRIFL